MVQRSQEEEAATARNQRTWRGCRKRHICQGNSNEEVEVEGELVMGDMIENRDEEDEVDENNKHVPAQVVVVNFEDDDDISEDSGSNEDEPMGYSSNEEMEDK